MTKFNILTVFLMAVAFPMISVAQPKMLSFPDPSTTTTSPRHNFYVDYVGARVTVLEPANIAGPVDFNPSNDGAGGQNEWGASIQSSPIVGVEIVKADPYEACAPLNNAAAINGKIALIKRNNCEFGAKAVAAQNAGAVAVIIVNNSAGPPVGMGAGAQGVNATIPVIMVSQSKGAQIEAELAGSNTVTMTMQVWGNNYNNDLGFVNTGVSLPHANTFPVQQLQGSSSAALKGFDGAVIANFGTTTATSVKVRATVRWTPGTPGSITGTGSVVHVDSVEITTPFAPADSILTPIFDNDYTLNPTGTGRYDVEYELIPNFTDDFMGDNTMSYSFYVDDRIYSKARHDFSNNTPIANFGSTLAGNANNQNPTMMVGPLYFVEKGNYAIEKVLFRAYNNDTLTDMSNAGEVDIAVYKWVDANNDMVMAVGECEMVGFKTHTFGSGDTSGAAYEAVVTDPLDVNKQVVTENNTWYWVTISAPNSILIGFDGELNYYPRSWGRIKATNRFRDAYSPLFVGTFNEYNSANATAATSHYPFDLFALSINDFEDSVRFSVQRRGLVPSIAMQMSLYPVSVDDVEESNAYNVNIYPNPASDVLNVNLNLEAQAEEVRYSVFTMLGGKVQDDVVHKNVQNDTYSVSTGTLTAGTYYLMISVDGESQVRKFTVVK